MSIKVTKDGVEEFESPRTRRQLLTGAAGALGAIAATSVLKAPAAGAYPGDPIVQGPNYPYNMPTWLIATNLPNGTNYGGPFAFAGYNLSTFNPVPRAVGLFGTTSDSDYPDDDPTAMGVRGTGQNGTGVNGTSTNGTGASGTSTNGTGINGTSTNGDGVQGRTSGLQSSAVFGNNTGGGKGVFAVSDSGIGLEASGGQAGVHAISSPSNTGVALKVDGRSVFRSAGVAIVPSGANKVTVSLTGVTANDFVLATVQGTGAFTVKSAVAGSGSFTVYISKPQPLRPR